MTAILALLELVPRRVLWALLAILLVLLAAEEVRIGAMRVSLAQARQQVAETVATLQTERAQAAQAAADLQATYRQAEQTRTERIVEIQHAQDTRLAALRSDADRAAAAARRLRAQLADLSARLRGQAAGNPGAAYDGTAAGADPGMLHELFGQCIERVRVLASAADASRAAGQQCEHWAEALKP